MSRSRLGTRVREREGSWEQLSARYLYSIMAPSERALECAQGVTYASEYQVCKSPLLHVHLHAYNACLLYPHAIIIVKIETRAIAFDCRIPRNKSVKSDPEFGSDIITSISTDRLVELLASTDHSTLCRSWCDNRRGTRGSARCG